MLKRNAGIRQIGITHSAHLEGFAKLVSALNSILAAL
jgi:hypothetical protein